MKFIFFLTSLFICFISCREKNYQKSIEDDLVGKHNRDTTSMFLSKDTGGGEYWLDVISDNLENFLILQTRRNNEILAISGYGNSSITLDDNNRILVDTIDFMNDKKVEYLLTSFIKGSTYGASVYYIIYFNNQWNIFQFPFDNLEVKYDVKINDFAVITYDPMRISRKFRFNSGVLKPIDNK